MIPSFLLFFVPFRPSQEDLEMIFDDQTRMDALKNFVESNSIFSDTCILKQILTVVSYKNIPTIQILFDSNVLVPITLSTIILEILRKKSHEGVSMFSFCTSMIYKDCNLVNSQGSCKALGY